MVVHAYLRDKKKAQFRTGRDAQWQKAGTHTHAKAWKTQLADDGVTWVVETNFFATKSTWCDGFADAHPAGRGAAGGRGRQGEVLRRRVKSFLSPCVIS